MLWLVLPGFFLLLTGWLLLAPLELKIDTVVPVISIRWMGIGSGKLIYEADEWRMKASFLFFKKSWSLEQLLLTNKKKKDRRNPGKKKGVTTRSFRKIFNLIKSFKVTQWQLAVDTGDHTRNARLYPINLVPGLQRHVSINFYGNNYLVLTIRNAVWRMIYAYLK